MSYRHHFYKTKRGVHYLGGVYRDNVPPYTYPRYKGKGEDASGKSVYYVYVHRVDLMSGAL